MATGVIVIEVELEEDNGVGFDVVTSQILDGSRAEMARHGVKRIHLAIKDDAQRVLDVFEGDADAQR